MYAAPYINKSCKEFRFEIIHAATTLVKLNQLGTTFVHGFRAAEQKQEQNELAEGELIT